MRVPKYFADKMTNYIDEADHTHHQWCYDNGWDVWDTDDPNELPFYLRIYFPEGLEKDGLTVYRIFDWGEICAGLWHPVHRKLGLCRFGLHAGWMTYTGANPTKTCIQCGKEIKL